MNVTSKSKQCNHTHSMNNKPLKLKSELNDISIVIDDNLNFFHHFLEKVNKTNQLMGLLRRAFYVYASTLTLLFKSLITHQM